MTQIHHLCSAPDQVSTPAYVKTLSRPHPRAVAGILRGFQFDPETGVLELRVLGDSTTPHAATEVFLGALQYPQGWTVTGTSGGWHASSTADGLEIRADGSAVGRELVLRVARKGTGG